MKKDQNKKVIAERPLLYSQKGKDERHAFRICLFEPYLFTREAANYSFGDQDLYVCELKSIDLEKAVSHEAYASDSMAAVHMAAAAVDFLVRRIRKNYDVFWPDGDVYLGNDEQDKSSSKK